MSKGYWNGQVFLKNEEKWNNYLAKYFEIEKNHLDNNTGNFVPIFAGQPKEKIQRKLNVCRFGILIILMLLIAIKNEEYQSALAELGKNLKKVYD